MSFLEVGNPFSYKKRYLLVGRTGIIFCNIMEFLQYFIFYTDCKYMRGGRKSVMKALFILATVSGGKHNLLQTEEFSLSKKSGCI